MKLDKVIAVRTSKTVYKDGDCAIKVFDADYKKSDILNEALNQARVEETGLPIPKLLEVGVIDGKWAIVSEFIKGKTLARLMDENPDKIDEYMNLFVDIQLDIHSRKAPLLNKLKDKMNRKISETDLDATTRYELHTRLEGMPKHNKVCHGDFRPSNVIVGEDGVNYIIDWAHATQGNAFGVFFVILFGLLTFAEARALFGLGYKLGRESVQKILAGGIVNKLIDCASIVGMFVMGALSASTVKVSTPLAWTFGEKTIVLQDTLNSIAPGILALAAVMFVFWGIKYKKWTITKLLVILIVVSLVGAFLGILSA